MFGRKPDWNRATDNLEWVFTPGQCIFKNTCITRPVVVKGGRKTEKEEVTFAVEVFELDTKGVKWIQENDKELWQLLATAITEKPGKPGFKIEEV